MSLDNFRVYALRVEWRMYFTGTLLASFERGEVPLYFAEDVNKGFKKLILDCCNLDASMRPTAGEVIERLLALKEDYSEEVNMLIVYAAWIVN